MRASQYLSLWVRLKRSLKSLLISPKSWSEQLKKMFSVVNDYISLTRTPVETSSSQSGQQNGVQVAKRWKRRFRLWRRRDKTSCSEKSRLPGGYSPSQPSLSTKVASTESEAPSSPASRRRGEWR